MNRHERRREEALRRKRMLRFDDLKADGIVNNRVTLGRWIGEQGFPAPIELGPNSVAWMADEVESWLSSRGRRHEAA